MVEVQGDGSVDGGLVHLSFGANANDLGFTFVKTRGLTPSANGIVAANDVIGSLNWFANDGTGTQFAAIIEALVDGSPAAGSMPARLGFYTTPSGTVSPVERLRIDSSGTHTFSNGSFNPSTNALGIITLTGSYGGGIVFSDTAFIGLWSQSSGTEFHIGVNGTSGGISSQYTFASSLLSTSANIQTPMVIGGAAASSTLTLESTSGVGTTDRISFKTGSQVEALRIDSSQFITLGGVASQTSQTLEINTTTNHNNTLGINGWSTSGATVLNIFRSNSSAIGTLTATVNNSTLGIIQFKSVDSNSAAQAAGHIGCLQDAAAVAGNVTSRLEFQPNTGSGDTLFLRLSGSAGVSSFTHCAFGYATTGNGDGGTVSQGTSITTGVTLSTVTGQITLFSGARASQTSNAFTLTNTKIASTDCLQIQHISGGTLGAYNFTASCASGSATINVRNITAGSLTEQPVLQFVLIKAVTT
jgi:hypothetical protein